MGINEFFIRDVRCFKGEQKFNIRPITFLTGENSTGKTTVLSCIQTLSNILSYRYGVKGTVDFNSAPYEMGTFINIVRKTKPALKEFALGFNTKYNNFKYEVILSAKEHSSEPAIQRIEWQFNDGKITIKPTETDLDEINVTLGKNNNEFVVSIHRLFITNVSLIHTIQSLIRGRKEHLDHIEKDFLKFLEGKEIITETDRLFVSSYSGTTSIAPIRSEPQRTYNPLGATGTHQGREIPNFMRNLKQSRKEQWKYLKDRLVEFGKSSGLFSNIDIKSFSKSSSDPFQLRVKANGPKSNLIDVGYGVSQVLPILVHTIMDRGETFLMQQPEVHLHPKAQAALASLLVGSVKINKNSFIVETHSDYMVDRVRMEIRKGEIASKDVSLIYMEAEKNKIVVHNIEFDDQANLSVVPEGYRDFFQKELDRLFDV